MAVVASPGPVHGNVLLPGDERICLVQQYIVALWDQRCIGPPEPIVPYLVTGRAVLAGIDVQDAFTRHVQGDAGVVDEALYFGPCISGEPVDQVDAVGSSRERLFLTEIGILYPVIATDAALIRSEYEGQFTIHAGIRVTAASPVFQGAPLGHDDVIDLVCQVIARQVILHL